MIVMAELVNKVEHVTVKEVLAWIRTANGGGHEGVLCDEDWWLR